MPPGKDPLLARKIAAETRLNVMKPDCTRLKRWTRSTLLLKAQIGGIFISPVVLRGEVRITAMILEVFSVLPLISSTFQAIPKSLNTF